MTTDYVVAVGFETDAGTVKRSTDQLADSVEKVGQAQSTAARTGKDLTTVSAQLERTQQRMAVQQQRLAEATSRVERFQRAGATGSKEYTKALEAQLVAQDRLASSILKAEKLQAGPAAPRRPGRSLAANVGAGVVGAVTGQALARLATDSIDQAGQLRATLQQNEQIFGANAREVVAIGKNSAEALGLSRQAAIAAADSYGSLFRTLHVGQAEAAGMSTSLVQIGVNLAAFSHSDPTQVFDALKGGLTGQYDALQKYDVVLNSTTVRQEAQRLGLVRGKAALTQTAQATAAYSLIVQQTADRQGAFANSADQVARQQAITAAKLADAKTQLGQGLIPAYLALADAATHTVIPALTALAKVIGFIVENDTARHITEIVVAAYAVNKAMSLGAAGVDRVAASYARLTGAATRATIAEREAAAAGPKGPVPPTTPTGPAASAAATGGAVLGAITTGVILAQTAQGPEQAIVDDGSKRGGAAGTAERIVGGILQATNGVTVIESAWNAFKVKTKEVDQVVSDTVPIDHLSAAFQKAQARIVVLASAQEKTNRAIALSVRASQDGRVLAAAAANQPLPGLFDKAPTNDVDITGLKENVRSARQAVALAQTKTGTAGQPTNATAAQIASAEASVASARAAARKPGGNFDAEQARLRAAELRLSELRQGGTRDATKAASAEKGLADARERLRKANKDLADGEEKLNGLSAATVLERSGGNKQTAQAEVRNVRRLVGSGLTSDVIEDLKKLETTAPGTLANVVKALTPAYVKQLNHDAAARRKAAQDLASLGGQAVHNDAVRRAAQLAKDQAQAYKDALVVALRDPAWRDEVLSGLGKLLTPEGVPGVPGSGQPPAGTPKGKGAPKDPLAPLFPPVDNTPRTPVPGSGRYGESDVSFRAPLRTQPASGSVVHLSPESVAAVGNHLRSGGSSVAQHTNVFPNVSNFGAAIDEAERRERRSRIMGG